MLSFGSGQYLTLSLVQILAIEDIDHSKTQAQSPQSNRICERFHRTIQNEFYAVAFRKKIYRSIAELQEDVDRWLQEYNEERTHSGKYCFGKTPMQTILDAKHLADEKMLDRMQPVEGASQEDAPFENPFIMDLYFHPLEAI